MNAARSAAGSSMPSASASRTRALSGASPGSRSTPRSASHACPPGSSPAVDGSPRARDAATTTTPPSTARASASPSAGGTAPEAKVSTTIPRAPAATAAATRAAVAAQVRGDVRHARLDARAGQLLARRRAAGQRDGTGRSDEPQRAEPRRLEGLTEEAQTRVTSRTAWTVPAITATALAPCIAGCRASVSDAARLRGPSAAR